ncbi:MAG: hypothetical protein GEU78_16895 [Actinobacteria bacterium]|nr:hypothetical protein [Actinomycetota bacterium]
MTARLEIPADAEELVAVFAADVVTAGLGAWPSMTGGARAFCACYPDPTSFADAPLAEQLALADHHRRFACWLMVTGRMSVSAEYLARANLRLGVAARNYHPRLHARVAGAAAMLGSDTTWINAQWSALAQLAALHGVAPDTVTAEQLERGSSALLAASARPGHPKAGQKLRTAVVRLGATLFHAGLVDVAPQLRRPDRNDARAAEWAATAPAVAATATRYLAQIELSLRGSTVAEAERSLREFASFLAREAPEVDGVADIRRHHIEAYKLWLAQRPRRIGGGTLHRHTIRARLLTLRCFFERITEWGYDVAPVRSRKFIHVTPPPASAAAPIATHSPARARVTAW